MCNEVVQNKPCMLLFVPDHFWTQEMCNEVIHTLPDVFHYIPDRFKTQEMCDQVVKEDSSLLEYVSDWFATKDWMWTWYDDYYDDDGDHWHNDNDEDKFFEWYDGYKAQKAQKVSIKEEFLTIVWHPSRWWDCCFPEDGKKEKKNLWA